MKTRTLRGKLESLILGDSRSNLGDEEELKALARSWLESPIHPILITPSRKVADGTRRVTGLLLIGQTEADLEELDHEPDETELKGIALISAIHRADLLGWDRYQCMLTLLALNPKWDQKDLAEFSKLSPATITNVLSPGKCSQAWQDALKEGKVTIKDCYKASRLSPDEQEEALRLRLGRTAKTTTRKRHKAVMKRINCPVAGGVTVTVAGKGLELPEAIQAMKASLDAMTRAMEKGMTATAAQRMWATA